MNYQPLEELLEKDLTIAYVNGFDGTHKIFYFEKSPTDIANFIMLHQENTGGVAKLT
jgi:hypothetical protein